MPEQKFHLLICAKQPTDSNLVYNYIHSGVFNNSLFLQTMAMTVWQPRTIGFPLTSSYKPFNLINCGLCYPQIFNQVNIRHWNYQRLTVCVTKCFFKPVINVNLWHRLWCSICSLTQSRALWWLSSNPACTERHRHTIICQAFVYTTPTDLSSNFNPI